MNNTELIISLECGLLVLFILLMFGGLMLYKWRNITSPVTRRSSGHRRNRNYVILPHTSAETVQLETNVKQVNNSLENNENPDRALLDDRSEAGRLYFSLKHNGENSIITIKLIKGENLPLITNDETKAFVSVQMFSHKGGHQTRSTENNITNYQRIYKFTLTPSEFFSHTIRFDVSRFDRFSKKYDIGFVTVPLADVKVDISRETFFKRNITPWKKIESQTHTTSERPCRDESPVLRRVRKDSKAKRRHPQLLWHKLSHAVHAGIYQGLLRGRPESLQWDPFLIIQKYEYTESDECLPPLEQELFTNRKRYDESSEDGEDISQLFTEDFHTTLECSPIHNLSSQPSDSSPETLKTPFNQDFYRLVHSPLLSKSDSADPVTSWSIPEIFQFPPLPVRVRSRAIVFQSTPATRKPRNDRLHKLTSLSSTYRKSIIRKSRKRTTSRRSKLTRMDPLHRLPLYLRKDTNTDNS